MRCPICREKLGRMDAVTLVAHWEYEHADRIKEALKAAADAIQEALK